MEIKEYSERFIHYYSVYIPPIIQELLAIHTFNSFADLGCGDGTLLYALIKGGYLEKMASVVAVDVSEHRISNVKKLSNKITAVVSDVTNMEFLQPESLDFVVSCKVIEHLKDDDRFVAEVGRKLKKNGLFYLSTVYKKWYGWYFYRCNGRWALDPTHLREYQNDSELLPLLKKHGFTVLINQKNTSWFPIADFFLKRLGFGRDAYDNRVLGLLRKIKVPIVGYYSWELLLRK